MGAAPYMNTENEKNAEQCGGLVSIQSHKPGQSQSCILHSTQVTKSPPSGRQGTTRQKDAWFKP